MSGTLDGMGVYVYKLSSVPFTAQFSSASQSVGENAGSATVTVKLSAKCKNSVTVPISVASIGTTASSSDYTFTGTSVIIPPGETTASVNIPLLNDQVYEGNETLKLQIGTPTNATVGSVSTHTLTITEDDPYVTNFADDMLKSGKGWSCWLAKNESMSESNRRACTPWPAVNPTWYHEYKHPIYALCYVNELLPGDTVGTGADQGSWPIVLRWTADKAGRASISGRFKGKQAGATQDVAYPHPGYLKIRVKNAQVAQGTIPGRDGTTWRTVNHTVNLNVGDTVDFVFGRQTSNWEGSMNFEATITVTPNQ